MYMWGTIRYETQEHIGQLRFICHLDKREGDKGLGFQRDSRLLTGIQKKQYVLAGHPGTMGHREVHKQVLARFLPVCHIWLIL